MEMNVCVVMCPDCGKQFKSMGPLKAHMKEVHEYENVICGECGKEFKNQARLKIHERLVHVRVDKVEYCDQCEKVFKNKGEVYHHKNAVHTIELIRCHICDGSSKNPYAFRKHFKKCSKKNPCVKHNILPCNTCLSKRINSDNLNHKNSNNFNVDDKFLETHTQKNIQDDDFKGNDENLVNAKEDLLVHFVKLEKKLFHVENKTSQTNLDTAKDTIAENMDENWMDIEKEITNIYSEMGGEFSNENNLQMPLQDAAKDNTNNLQKAPSDLLVNTIKEIQPNLKLEKDQTENERDCIENNIFESFKSLEENVDDNSIDLETEEFEFESLDLHQALEDSYSSSFKDNKFVKDEPGCIDIAVHNPLNKDDMKKTSGKTFTRKRYIPGLLVCELCAKSFSKQTSLNQHVRNVHSSDRKCPVVCEVCSKEYNKFTIKQHSKIHTDGKSECDFCKQMYSKGNLLAHMRRIHSKRESATVICEICCKNYSEQSIKSHVENIHGNSGKCKCDVCEKEFKSRAYFLAHTRRVHSQRERETVICEICCKNYSENSIKSHVENVHGKSGNFQCDVCKKEFKSKDYLSNHKHYVHSDRTFPCEACGNTFANKQYLAKHIKTVHANGEDGCSCETCGKRFLHKNFLKHHIKAVHVLETMECEYCKKTYKNNYLLRKHVRKYHDE